jgi:uncharacterized protein YcfJ
MNFDATTRKLVQSWIRAHVKFIGEVANRLNTVSSRVGHQFDGDEEYLLTADGIGYHVEYEVDMTDGHIKFNAVPGRFVPSSAGMVWVNGKNRLHSEIERKCDQKETSLLIQ